MNLEISKYLFSVNQKDSEYHFRKMDDFNIRIKDKDFESSYDVFIKPAHSAFAWLKVKTLYHPQHIFDGDEALHIVKSIKVSKFDERYYQNGIIQIFACAQIEIDKNVQINGNECGLNRKCEQNNDNLLKYGHLNSAKTKVNGFGGGIIEIVSSTQNILNYGTLSCDASNYHFCGGTILINAMSKFINFGKISAMPNGRIIVKCKKYKNMGTITPEPIIIYEPKPQFCPVYKPWKQSIKNMVKEKKRNLLNKKNNSK